MAVAVAVSVPTPHPKSMAALFARRNTKPVMKFLEINLICAQSLQPPKQRRNNPQSLRTYAVVSIDKSTKLTTRLDSIGGQNPTWNDKFVFRVPADFLASETSSVSVEIYAVRGFIKDFHVGSARLLLSTCIDGNQRLSMVKRWRSRGSSAFSLLDSVGDSHQRLSMVKRWRSRSRSRSPAAVMPRQSLDSTDIDPSFEEKKSCRDLHQQIVVAAAPVLF